MENKISNYLNCSISYLKWLMLNESSLDYEDRTAIILVLNLKED